MTGLAPISNAAAVGANSAVAANSGAQSADSGRPSDFSVVLNARANAPQAAPSEGRGKNVIAASSSSNRPQKTSTPQTISLASVVSARVAVPGATPAVALSALLSYAGAPLPPPVPVPPPAADAQNLLAAAPSLNGTDATRLVANSSLGVANGNLASRALPAATAPAIDLINAQAETMQAASLDGENAVGGVAVAWQSASDSDQSAAIAAEAEVAAIISSAADQAAAGNSSQAGSAQCDSRTTSSILTTATTSGAKTQAQTEASAKVGLPHTALPMPLPVAPKGSSGQPAPAAATPAPPASRSAQDGGPDSQRPSSDTVPTNSRAATATLQQGISDARDKLVQAIGANLQAEISAAPGKTITNADAANGAGGNLAQQNPGNSEFNSSAQDLLRQNGDPATSIAASVSGNSSDDTNGLSANGVTSAAGKAVALATAAIESVAPHAIPDAAPQAVSTATAPTASPPASTNNASAARPEPPQQPLPQSLPQSLNDVAKASEMYQRVGGSEMHIAMETDLLGAVDLRATMHQSTLTAIIGVQRADVQALLANELPALQHTLADKNFHVEQISVLNNSVGDRAGSGGQQQAAAQNQNQNPFMPRAGYLPSVAATAASSADDLRTMAGASSMAHTGSDDSGRISVHV